MEVKNLIRWMFGKFGLRLIRIKNIKYLFTCDALDDFFSSLQGLGFAPKHIIDVGAKPRPLDPHGPQVFSGRPLYAH